MLFDAFCAVCERFVSKAVLPSERQASVRDTPCRSAARHPSAKSVPAGVIAVKNTWNEMNFRFYPGVDASWRFADNFRLYGSWNRALRMPTFTDLFYSSKTNIGNPDLKPEESEAFELGVKYGTYFLRAHVAGFYRKGKNMIACSLIFSQLIVGEPLPFGTLTRDL